MKQKEKTKEIIFSRSALQRYRQDIKMQSPYKSNNPKRPQNMSNVCSANILQSVHDLKRPHMTSRNLLQIGEVN